jgi:hypothetical protein
MGFARRHFPETMISFASIQGIGSDSKVPSESLNAHCKATSSSFKHQSSILSCRPCGHALRITSNDERPAENGNPRRKSERVTSRTELGTVAESHPTSLTDYNVSRSDGRLLRSAVNPYGPMIGLQGNAQPAGMRSDSPAHGLERPGRFVKSLFFHSIGLPFADWRAR